MNYMNENENREIKKSNHNNITATGISSKYKMIKGIKEERKK